MSEYKKDLDFAIELMGLKKLLDAESRFISLTKEFPDEIEPYFYLGNIEFQKNNLKKAIQYLEKALSIAPNYICHKTLGEYYIFAQDPKNAVKNIEMALIYDPFDENLKKILYKLKPNTNFIDKSDIFIDGIYEKSKDCSCLRYTKSYNAYTGYRKLPIFIKEQFTQNQINLLEQAIEKYQALNVKEGFVLDMSDAIVFVKQSEQTHFITPDNKLLADMLDKNAPMLNESNFSDILVPCDNLLVLSSCWGGNFYHWLTWTVPRLKMIFDAGYRIEDFDKILINFFGFKFQKEVLNLLKIPTSKIIGTLPRGTVLKPKRIVSSSLPEFIETPEIVTQSLREFFLKPEYMNSNKPKRIYLSRNKSNSRHVLNEDEVTKFLKDYDFTTIYAEDLTFAEQVEYFANADVIISQHGAGLTNIAFCHSEAKVIEIYNERIKSVFDASFWRISSNVGIEHYFMFGEPIGEGALADMKIDVSKLTEILQLAQIEKR